MLWLNTIILQLNLCIFVCYFIYCSILLCKHHRQQYFVKRRPIFVLIFHLSLLSWATFRNDLYFANINFDSLGNIYLFVDAAWCLFTVGLGTTAYICRIWLLYFDMQLSRSLQNKSWQMAIDPNIESNNWFLNPKNQRQYGRNGKRMLFYAFLLDILVCTIYGIMKKLMQTNFGQAYMVHGYYILTLYFFVKLIVAIKIWKKFGKFKIYDNFGIYHELTKSLQISALYALVQPIIVPLSYIFLPYSTYIVGTPAVTFGIVIMYYLIPNVIKYNANMYMSSDDHGVDKPTDTQCTDNQKPQNTDTHANRASLSVSLKLQVLSIGSGSRSQSIGNITGIPPGMRSRSGIIDGFSADVDQPAYTHWSQAVTSPYIYEKFMNHLETEFSVENLLFVTEYVQMKHVLMQNYCQLEQMMKDNISIKFDIKLPQNDLDNHDDTHTPEIELMQDVDIVDHSHDAAHGDINGDVDASSDQLQSKSMDHSNLGVNTSRSRLSAPSFSAELPPVVPISLIAKQLCKDLDIIVAFKSLYNKYIDADNAPFMINISSSCREELMKSLDCNYYNNMKCRRNNFMPQQKQKSLDRLDKIFTTVRTSSGIGNHKSRCNHDNESNLPNKSLIDDEWLQRGKSVDWLLVKLLSEMDCGARQISSLMNQSFLRFRKRAKMISN